MIGMPGKSHQGPLPALTAEQAELARALRADVVRLATEIGERNMAHVSGLRETEAFLSESLSKSGLEPRLQPYAVDGVEVRNVWCEVRGGAAASEVVVVGAHYDTVYGCPGANDNGTGVAACLALARAFAGSAPRRTLRFAFFVNEEPPNFQTDRMGSLVHARSLREKGENVVGMLSLETMGYYADAESTQKYPFPMALFYPTRGDFIGFVGNRSSRPFVRETVASFRKHAQFPSEGAALPGFISAAGWSDQWSFWQVGYPGLMVTDTAPFRYPAYHRPDDTPDKIDFDRLARVVEGLRHVVADLAL
jgi:hypothetical protein